MSNEESFPSRKAVAASKKIDLSGKYRVKEGYQVAYGQRVDEPNAIGNHPVAKAGEIIQLSHEEAVAIIRNTSGALAKGNDGRQHGPAIESEAAFKTRLEAEQQRDEFMRSLAEITT